MATLWSKDLPDSLWMTISTYLDPIDRFVLCTASKHFHHLFSVFSYPIYSFYKSDVNYWMHHLRWLLSSIQQQSTPHSLPSFALNLSQFDTMDRNLLLHCKYFIIFYDRICAIRVNQRIEKKQHLLALHHDENQHQMQRLSDDDDNEYENDNQSVSDSNDSHKDKQQQQEEAEAKQLADELELLHIDLEHETDFIPTTIMHLYLHELSNRNQSIMHWISDCIQLCASNCGMFGALHFDKSNLDNASMDILCASLLRRKQPFSCLKHFFLSDNPEITDECVGKLLDTLHKTCDGLVELHLDATGITNRSCHVVHAFYMELLNMKEVNQINLKIPKWQYLNVSHNEGIDTKGIDMLNDIFIQYGKFNVKHNLCGRNTIQLNLDIDVVNCDWSVPRMGWSQHILCDS